MTKTTIDAEILALSDLIDDPENANLGTRRGAEMIDASVAKFGFLEPGVIGGDNIIISGNKRKIAAAHNGITKALVIDLPDDTAVYVRKSNLNLSDPDDLAAREAGVTLNRAPQVSIKWDAVVTQAFEKKGVNFKGLFTEDELPHIHLRKPAQTRNADTSTFDAEALAEKHDVSPSPDLQIWRIGPHLLACGDARIPSTWTSLLDGRPVDVVFTSPPYAEQRSDTYGGVPAAEYVAWWEDLQANVAAHLSPEGSFFVNIKPHVESGQRSLYVYDLVVAMVRRWQWLHIDEFSWQRIGTPGSWPNRFKNGFEPVHHFARSAAIKFRPRAVALPSSGKVETGANKNNGGYYNMANKTFEWDQSLPSNVLPIKKIDTDNSHSAAFPVELPEFFVRAYSDPGDVILDSFSGAGTTILAAARNDRIGIGIELKPEHIAITLERLAIELNLQPEKL